MNTYEFFYTQIRSDQVTRNNFDITEKSKAQNEEENMKIR
jgi:hypothetical protein